MLLRIASGFLFGFLSIILLFGLFSIDFSNQFMAKGKIIPRSMIFSVLGFVVMLSLTAISLSYIFNKGTYVSGILGAYFLFLLVFIGLKEFSEQIQLFLITTGIILIVTSLQALFREI